jgi:hypothetical protein
MLAAMLDAVFLQPLGLRLSLVGIIGHRG